MNACDTRPANRLSRFTGPSANVDLGLRSTRIERRCWPAVIPSAGAEAEPSKRAACDPRRRAGLGQFGNGLLERYLLLVRREPEPRCCLTSRVGGEVPSPIPIARWPPTRAMLSSAALRGAASASRASGRRRPPATRAVERLGPAVAQRASVVREQERNAWLAPSRPRRHPHPSLWGIGFRLGLLGVHGRGASDGRRLRLALPTTIRVSGT